MLPILWWIIATALGSFWTPPYKKALGLWKNIPNSLFKAFAPSCGIIIFVILIQFLWFQNQLFSDVKAISLILFIAIISTINQLIWLRVYKVTKLSELLPYWNIDKLFIIIFWFFLYQWVLWKETSTATLVITIATLLIIAVFTIDFKNIKISKSVGLFIVNRLLWALTTLIIWYILIQYTTITYGFTHSILEIILLISISIYWKNKLWVMLQQSKSFYKYRFSAIAMWQANFIIWLFLIESLWIVIASLLGFISVVFNILAMKLMLNDTPTKKQIILAFIVIFMIWIGYYFK